jgi:hypothetical protein
MYKWNWIIYVFKTGQMNISHVCTACYQHIELSDTCPVSTLLCLGSSNLNVRRTQVPLVDRRGITRMCFVWPIKKSGGKLNHYYWVLRISRCRPSHSLFTVLQFSNWTLAMHVTLVWKNGKISRLCSLLMVKFSFVRHVDNLLSHNIVLRLHNI